ncbi:MAG: MBL fold metallo-hydrolase [Bacteroidota bacterium]
MKNNFTLLLITFLSFPLFAQRDFSKVEIKTFEVTDKIHMLVGAGGNIGVLEGEDGIFMIDNQYGPLSEKIKTAVGNISNQPIKYVLNTHWHFDHTGGNLNFNTPGLTLVAHENVKIRLENDQHVEPFGWDVKALATEGLPELTFTDKLTLYLNGEEIVIIHPERAHTDGDAITFFKTSNVIHAGDVFVRYGYPFIDASSGGSIDGIIDGLNMIISLSDENTKIIPGHGELASRSDVMEVRNMLEETAAVLKKEIANGSSVDDIINANPLAKWDERWNNNFITSKIFIQLVHASLTTN